MKKSLIILTPNPPHLLNHNLTLSIDYQWCKFNSTAFVSSASAIATMLAATYIRSSGSDVNILSILLFLLLLLMYVALSIVANEPLPLAHRWSGLLARKNWGDRHILSPSFWYWSIVLNCEGKTSERTRIRIKLFCDYMLSTIYWCLTKWEYLSCFLAPQVHELWMKHLLQMTWYFASVEAV